MKSPPSAFGRATPKSRDRARALPPLPAKRRGPAPQAAPAPGPAEDDLAAELAAWKQARPGNPFPWRQVSLVLGLCFAAASQVLPDRINDSATYVLYALAGISFVSGLARRRKNPS